MNSDQRLHSLDNLRAVMMWLGIVVHVSVNYMVNPSPTPWRDVQTSIVADLLIIFIHAFRMPVFFILAGFFVAMLVEKRGVAAMLTQRVSKLVWPFLLFWPLLYIFMGLLVAVYAYLNAFNSLGIDFALVPRIPGRPTIALLHLWFIYYLFLYCLVYALLLHCSIYIPAQWNEAFAKVWKTLCKNWWGVFMLALPLAIAGGFYRNGVVTPLGSFLPDAAEFVHSGIFFTCGIFIHHYQGDLLDIYARKCWYFLMAGFPLLILFLGLSKQYGSQPSASFFIQAVMAYLYNCVSWFWSFALIGLFLRYLSKQNRVLAYMADSSYWVYLVHMLGTLGFGILLYHSPFDALGRMVCNILLTSLSCLLTYHFFVRHSFIEVFLNGGNEKLKPITPSAEG
ncbi:acyltransferase family protein [Undibacterium pigrum]|uniref:Peptidoglycan/LPS O-acetylase OafA/YrhL n=1 Tax=Undibacterium pigrum TaxID=401470 RepID=A0A318JS39_9BURK|nr:acyltransferase family protein [Undibacterium pigrum]PXX43142.1 peptidoglycan/LPS O-acetylase OafA/YrhL [Undibacterium pigrum]